MVDGGGGRGWGEIRDSHLAVRAPLPWAMRAWSNLPLCLAPGPLEVFAEGLLASFFLGILLSGCGTR